MSRDCTIVREAEREVNMVHDGCSCRDQPMLVVLTVEMELEQRRDTFTWFDYSRKLRGLSGTGSRQHLNVLPAAVSEEDEGGGAPGGGEEKLLDRDELRRVKRTYSQPGSRPFQGPQAGSRPCQCHQPESRSRCKHCPPVVIRRRLEVTSGDSSDDMDEEVAFPRPPPAVSANRKTHSRTSSFPEVRVRSRPGPSSTLPRPHTQQSLHPVITACKSNSLDDDDADVDPAQAELELHKRGRVNSFTDVKNAVRDKFKDVKTRVRRISSHSRPAADKPPKQARRPAPATNEPDTENVQRSQGNDTGKAQTRQARQRRESGSSGSDGEGCGAEMTAAEALRCRDLPPQHRTRVNSFTDVKNAMKEKLKNVHARTRRRTRMAGGTSSDAPAPPSNLKRRSLSFQNLVMPSLLVRVASSPDVSQIGIATSAVAPVKNSFRDECAALADLGARDKKEDAPLQADWAANNRRRQSLTNSTRTASTDSSDVTNGTDGDVTRRGSSDVTRRWSGDVTRRGSGDVIRRGSWEVRRSRGEWELAVMLEDGQDSIHSDSTVSDVTAPRGDGDVMSNSVDERVGYHGDNDTDDEDDTRHDHDNDLSAGPYVALTLLGRATGGRGGPQDAGQPPGALGSPPLPPDTGSDRITGPQPVNDTMNLELQNQKVAFTRMMYEKATSQFENMKAERHLTEPELNDQLRTIRRLEAALYELTGIPAESHLANLGKRSPPPGYSSTLPYGAAGHHYSSPLPPLPHHHAPSSVGHTHTSHAHIHIRRYPSGEHLHTSSEGYHRDSAHHHHHQDGIPPSTVNPAPWLPGGPRQRKLDSGSDVTYGEDVPRRDVTITRTHSDSRKRSSHLGHDGVDITHDKNKIVEFKKYRSKSEKRPPRSKVATSLPANVEEPGDPAAHSPSPGKDDGPLSDSNDDYADLGHYDEGGPAIIPMMTPGTEGGPYSPNQVLIMGAEDDFSDEEEGQLDEHGPFSDLNALKRKPSHLAVFLNYLISNSDPSPLLFYLVTDNYANGTTKEMKKWAYEIHSTFLVNKAPLRVNVEEQIVANIDNTLLTKSDKVDIIQSAFGLARHHVQNEISELLADFRNKCALGLGSLYGTHEISTKDTMERTKELHLVEKYLVPHFERLLANEESSDRNQAMAYALATVLKQVGCTLSGKTATTLERCPSFVAKDKKTFKLQTNRRKWVVRDHTFVPSSYYTSTQCHLCSNNIWGIGVQGYQCSVCEMNVHKHCVEGVKECLRRKKRVSSIMNIIRKPSVVTQPQTVFAKSGIFNQHLDNNHHHVSSKDSARWSDDGYTSPGSSSTFLRGHKDDYDDDEADRSQVTRPVSQIEQLSPRITDDARSCSSPPRSRSPDPNADADAEHRIPTTPIYKPPKKKHVVRSESLKGKQEAKSKTVRRSQSDLHVDDPHVKTVLNQSGSDTSIAGSLESPSNSSELLHDHRGMSGDSHWIKSVREEVRSDDSDIDVENELPPLNASIPAEQIKKLKPKEKKRQDVMNELLHTERTHVRTLKVMHDVFYMNMVAGLAPDLAHLLFPNIDELIKVHCTLNKGFKSRKQDNPLVSHVGDLLLGSFAGEAGEEFKTVCATFCRHQSHGLETLRVRQRKDQKLAVFLQQEASMNPLCRRLELKDLIPTVMQRLTKYPLLIENLLKYTQAGSDEHAQLKTSLTCSRDILSHVNEAVKESENEQKLQDIQRRLDKRSFENSSLPMVAEYKNLDLTQHKMVYDGPLTWRIGRSKQIELHVVLLENMLVLLQRQDDKYVLKCSTTVVSGREDSKYTHSPVLKLSNVLARNVANDKRAFFLVCTSDIGPQIYELHAMSAEEKNKWLRYISDAVDSYKERTSKQPNKTPTLTSPDEKLVRKEPKEDLPVETEGLERLRSSSVDSLDKVTVLQATNQAELIQPTEVVISDTVLEEAEPVLSLREMLKRKDAEVHRGLEEKDRIVAEILNVPSADYANIAEMASDIEGEKDVRELVLGATYQTSRLTQLVNDCLTVEEDVADPSLDSVSPTVGTASAGRLDDKPAVTVTLATSAMLDVTRKLNEQLSLLLGLVGEQEEVNKRLQHDLDVANEQLALTRDVIHRSPSNSLSRHSRPNSFASITSSTSEVAETPEEGQHLASSSEETALFLVTSTPQDVAVMSVSDVVQSEVVEGDEANHNTTPCEQTEHPMHTTNTLTLTDANLNDDTSRCDDDAPPTT